MPFIGSPDLVIEEKIEHKIRKTIYAIVKHKNMGIIPYPFQFNTTLKRFAAQDLYSIYNLYDGNLLHESWEHGKYGHQVINIINNKIKLQKHFVLGERDYKLSSGNILFHHSEVSQKFRDTSYLYTYLKGRDIYEGTEGNWRFSKGKSLFRKIVAIASFLNFPKMKKNYKIASDNIVEMKFIKELGIRTNQRPYIIHHKSSIRSANLKIQTLQKVSEPYLHTKFSKFYIKFKKLDWIGHNSHIATIYWEPNDKSDVFNSDFSLQVGSHIKIDNKKYEIVFEKNENLKTDQKNIDNTNKVIAVGKILIPSFTSYDFTKKKITNDFNEFSERGIFIPYDFKGEFFYKIQFGINEVFKDMVFFVKQDVAQKTLDPYAGKIKIQITTSDTINLNSSSQVVVLSSKNFKEIIDLGETVNPVAILRFAHNEEEI